MQALHERFVGFGIAIPGGIGDQPFTEFGVERFVARLRDEACLFEEGLFGAERDVFHTILVYTKNVGNPLVVRVRTLVGMRVTVSHKTTKEEVRRAVEQAVDQLFRDTPPGLLTITDQRREWDGDTLRFWMTAKMGVVRNPIQGWIAVTGQDLTVDVDLGMLNLLFPEQKVRKTIEDQLRGKLLGPGKA